MSVPGDVILLRSGGKLSAGVVVEVTTKHLSVAVTAKKRLKVHPDKIVMRVGQSSDPPDALASTLDRVSPADIKLDDLHELVADDAPADGFPLQELISLITDDSTLESIVGHALAIDSDSIYFVRKDDSYIPRPSSEVSQRLSQAEAAAQRAAEKAQRLNEGREAVMSALQKGQTLEPSPAANSYLAPLWKAVTFVDDPQSPRQGQLQEIVSELHPWLNDAANSPVLIAEQILHQLGLLNLPNPLSTEEFALSTSFPQAVLDEVQQLLAQEQHGLPGDDLRRDCRALHTVTIDDVSSLDLDDAISVVEADDGFCVYVHISDVAAAVKPDTALDQIAIERGTTVYRPEGNIPMLPEDLSEGLLSLLEGHDRRAMTFEIKLDSKGQVLDRDLYPSWIHVDRRLTYEDATPTAHAEGELKAHLSRMIELMHKVQEHRRTHGALNLNTANRKIAVDAGQVSIKVVDDDLPSSVAVREAMILANHQTAMYCYTRSVPCIYVFQPAPEDPPSIPESGSLTRLDIAQIVRKLRRSELSSVPATHYTLGVGAYVQATSPIRRYQDLIIHRQLHHLLETGKPLYSKEEIQVAAASAESGAQVGNQASRKSRRYWSFAYLQQTQDAPQQGFVMRDTGKGLLVELDVTGLTVWCGYHADIVVGDLVWVRIESVHPRLGQGSFSIIDRVREGARPPE